MSEDNLKEYKKEEINELPQIIFDGEIVIVSDKKQEKHAAEYLSKHKAIGFDTETRPSFKKGKPNNNDVALLQLSTEEKAFLYRLNKTKLSKTTIRLLSSNKVIKAGAAVKDDIKLLQALYKFTPGGFIDLQDMATEAEIDVLSLRKLTAMFFDKRLSKSQRLSNWEAEELSEPQKEYAATDAWISLKIYKKIKELL